jgi:hypothetical protein
MGKRGCVGKQLEVREEGMFRPNELRDVLQDMLRLSRGSTEQKHGAKYNIPQPFVADAQVSK